MSTLTPDRLPPQVEPEDVQVGDKIITLTKNTDGDVRVVASVVGDIQTDPLSVTDTFGFLLYNTEYPSLTIYRVSEPPLSSLPVGAMVTDVEGYLPGGGKPFTSSSALKVHGEGWTVIIDGIPVPTPQSSITKWKVVNA